MKKIVLILFTFITMAMAESYPFTHDGFYLNFAMGFGFQGFDYKGTGEYRGNDLKVKVDGDGGSFEFDMKIGGRILPYTVLHATINQVHYLSDLRFKAEYRGEKISSSSESGEAMILYGIGVTYYIAPYNFFVSTSLGPVKFALTDKEGVIDGTSDFGFGFQLAAGKEWWVSENWGIGAMAALTYGAADDKDGHGEMSACAFNFMFTATFN